MTDQPSQAMCFNAQEAINNAEQAFFSATDANGMLDALARGKWIKAHGTECPPRQIPTVDDLVEYTAFITDSDIDQVTEQIEQLSRWFFQKVHDHDNVTVQAGWIVPRHVLPCHTLIHYIKTGFSEKSISENETLYHLLTGHNVRRPMTKPVVHIPFYPENVFFYTYKAWIEAKGDGFKGSPPLSLLIELWHNQPPEIESTQRYDHKRPVWIARYPRGNFDLDLFSDSGDMGELRRFADDTVLPGIQMVLPKVQKKSVIRDPNKLLLAHVDGVATKTRAGAVSPELRIFVEAIMSMPVNERIARVKIKLDELISRLYPDGFHWTNQSPKLLAAIRNIDKLTVPFINSSGNIQHGYAPVKLNTMNFQRRNDDVIFTVTLPDSVSGGPVVEKHFVRLLGLKSDPKWQAYLTLCDLFHRYGIYKNKDGKFSIYDPTRPVERRNDKGHLLNAKGKVIRSDKGEPLSNLYDPEAYEQLDRESNQWAIDQYPIVSFDDMLKACFPGRVYKNGSERGKYLKRAKEHFEVLAHVSSKTFGNKPLNAIQLVRHANGWQFLPGKSHIKVYRGVAESGSK